MLFFIYGCAQQQIIHPIGATFNGTERVFDKNYEIGKKLIIYVGQPVIKVKDYNVKSFTSTDIKSSDNFILSLGAFDFSGSKNITYKATGETLLNGKIYKIISLPSQKNSKVILGLLINSDGNINFLDSLINLDQGSFLVSPMSLKISPSNLKFEFSKENIIDVNSGYLNYELIYGGTDGKSIMISYREYTATDMARPAFYQDLTYQVDKKNIRFKDTTIEVYESTNERFVYKVISDGLSK